MPTVSFQVGTAFTKKRKRMCGTNNANKVEVKQWNPRQDGEGDTYNGINLLNIINSEQFTVANCTAWLPKMLYMPQQGTTSYQRIGSKIFLKYLRFKGYIAVYPNAIVGSRWRLRLIRTDNLTFTQPTTSAECRLAMKTYMSYLKNNETFDANSQDWLTPNSVLNISVHNFYKAFKNVDNRNVMKTKVIASGYIPAIQTVSHKDLDGSLTGNSAGVISLVGYDIPLKDSNGVYHIPIDVKVKCNDYVDGNDIRYYYVLETDYGAGWILGDTGGKPTLTQRPDSIMYRFSFFIRGYYTDC